MGIIVPNYTKLESPNNGGLITPTTYQNVYISLRFEQANLKHNPDGQTYVVNGMAKVYQNQTSVYVLDIINYNFVLTKDQLNTPLHTLIYNYLKSQYSGSSNSN